MFETENTWQDTNKEKEISVTLFGQKENQSKHKKKKTKSFTDSKSSNSVTLLEDSSKLSCIEKNVSNEISSTKNESSEKKNCVNAMKRSICDDSFDSASHKKLKCDKSDDKANSSTSVLGQKLFDKLQSSRFRFINEKMYTNESKDTMEMFEDDPQSFEVYHKGFKSQVLKWPMNPLDLVISWIKTKPSKLIVADMGCGEAELAQSVKNKVHSFDLCSVNPYVTVADMSQVPLENNSVDIVVFCLSLMGTNLKEFVFEANRILRNKGFLKIVEVASRFQKVSHFVRAMKDFGFISNKVNTENSHFYVFDFQKGNDLKRSILERAHKRLELKPCYYKKR